MVVVLEVASTLKFSPYILATAVGELMLASKRKSPLFSFRHSVSKESLTVTLITPTGVGNTAGSLLKDFSISNSSSFNTYSALAFRWLSGVYVRCSLIPLSSFSASSGDI